MTSTNDFLSRLHPAQWVLVSWALLSFGLSLLPTGVGGPPRAVNAVLFMTFGPGCAMLVFLLRFLAPAVAVVVAGGTSLAILVLGSQVLLIAGVWRAWGVTALVALATIAIALLPKLVPDDRPAHGETAR